MGGQPPKRLFTAQLYDNKKNVAKCRNFKKNFRTDRHPQIYKNASVGCMNATSHIEIVADAASDEIADHPGHTIRPNA